MRSPTFRLMIVAIAIILVAQPVAALTVMKVPYFRTGPVWYLGPSMSADLFILETNTDHLTASDNEAFALSFSPASDHAGDTVLAPLLGQTSSRTIACTRSYFYEDFLGV